MYKNKKIYVAPMMQYTDKHDRYFLRIISKNVILFTEKQIKKINGPVGIDIRAKSPNEIAVAIMSEIIFTYRSYYQ